MTEFARLLDGDAQDHQGRGAHRPLPRREGDRAADRLHAPEGRGLQACTLDDICGGLFELGDHYDLAELYPVFVPKEDIVRKVLADPD